MSKHTPGPWSQCEQVSKPHQYALVGIGNGAVHVGYVSVTPAMSPFGADANARLIAAAPELLSALERLLPLLDIAHGYEGDVFGIHHNESMDAEQASIAAIAKAKGEA